jgi:restriction endonuclease-like protein
VNWSLALKEQLQQRAKAWAAVPGISSYQSIGKSATVIFERSAAGDAHGNFFDASWTAILANPAWESRTHKVHTQRKALPTLKASSAMETDSSNSSDALLMNCFCYPDAVSEILGGLELVVSSPKVEFGVKAQVPLADGQFDATEIDMRIGEVLFEAKLTEEDFTSRPMAQVVRYKGIVESFDLAALPTHGGEVRGYQLVRNVLAAKHHQARLVVLVDQRRPDLLQEWWQVHASIIDSSLRARCGFRTWQQVAAASPRQLQVFLESKYGV